MYFALLGFSSRQISSTLHVFGLHMSQKWLPPKNVFSQKPQFIDCLYSYTYIDCLHSCTCLKNALFPTVLSAKLAYKLKWTCHFKIFFSKRECLDCKVSAIFVYTCIADRFFTGNKKHSALEVVIGYLQDLPEPGLKGNSQLAPIRIRYHFIANLHITETRSILCLTTYEKKHYRMSKSSLKNRFLCKRLKIKQTSPKIKAEF